ncbi:hypothetical protein M513_09504 [Trichuris suis]|uniref:Uncharacterized protein n=1 Tax=Trichuris suis TaxID=68888 RepID=A0A085LXH6_9BILA|nr:hypothetical protein M513_09504 [Trichuris suis]
MIDPIPRYLGRMDHYHSGPQEPAFLAVFAKLQYDSWAANRKDPMIDPIPRYLGRMDHYMCFIVVNIDIRQSMSRGAGHAPVHQLAAGGPSI